ncbi:hypothetical protein L208DRAFT_364155 [Tricholoma matsutake]|nr:hypothetical protein L208DRAFT_364155 [Tricholoma matsutake 945]
MPKIIWEQAAHHLKDLATHVTTPLSVVFMPFCTWFGVFNLQYGHFDRNSLRNERKTIDRVAEVLYFLASCLRGGLTTVDYSTFYSLRSSQVYHIGNCFYYLMIGLLIRICYVYFYVYFYYGASFSMHHASYCLDHLRTSTVWIT